MPRLSVLLVIWLALLGGGWVLDFFFAARVVGVGCLMLSFVPLVLARNRRLLVCAWVLTTVALVSPLPMRPSVLSDPEEVAGRILAVSVAWGWICVALLEDRWRRRSARSEARLRTVTSVLSSVIWVGDADKRFADPHSEWSDFTGQKREQWHGEGWVSAVHPDDRDRVREMWLAPDPNAWPDRYDLEVRVWHGPSGQYRYVQTCVRPLFADGGELVEWVGVLVDIHDRKMSELAGVESRHRLADAQRLARLGHWEFDVASGIVRVSAELSEAFGGPAKVVSLPIEGVLNIITPDARDAARTELKKLLEGDREHRGEYAVLLNDGVRRVGAVLAKREVSRDGVVTVWGTVQNVTEHVRARERERDLEVQLIRSSKMHTVGELSTGLAHDFNNALTGMLGYGELARKRVRGGDAQMEMFLGRVLEAGGRARDLVRTLMSFGRGNPTVEAGGRAVTNIELGSVVSEALNLMRAALPSGVQLRTEIDADVVVNVDRLNLQDALLNLCINARDAVAPSGTVTVAVTHQKIHEDCSVCGERLRGTVAVITVRDNGAGIEPAVLPRIFEPFYSTKGEHQGTGMGLAMVARLMHSHRGHVVVTSRRGDTRFALVFPTATQAVPTPAVASAPPSVAPESVAAASLAVWTVAAATPAASRVAASTMAASALALATDATGTAGGTQLTNIVAVTGATPNSLLPSDAARSAAAGLASDRPPTDAVDEARADALSRAVQRPAPVPTAEPASGARKRVLVVDDEPPIGRLIASALEPHGMVVSVFVEPREAAAAYEVNPDRWDLLITDLTMPGMSGLELAGLVRASRNLPVLLLTGGGASDEELGAAGVIDRILRKPFAMTELVRVAAGLLRDAGNQEVSTG